MMQWHSCIDPGTNQVLTGAKTIISTVVAVMIIAFANDIKNLVIGAETSDLRESNTRQNLEIIANSVTVHGNMLTIYNERILRLEISNEEHRKMQSQIAMNTALIRKIQSTQTSIVTRVNGIISNNRAFESRLKREELE